MRILHVPHAYPPVLGGAELYCRRLSEELVKLGHHVRVLTTNVGSVEDYYRLEIAPVGPAREVLSGVEIVRVSYGDPLSRRVSLALREASIPGVSQRAAGHLLRHWRRRLARRFEREITDYAPDVVMTMPHLVANVEAVLAARSRRVFPLVMLPLLHDDDPDWPRAAMRDALRVPSAVVAITEHEATLLRERYEVPAPRIHLGLAGVDAPEAANAAGRAPRVLFLGRKTAKKGLHALIDAMRDVWRVLPQATLVLAGARTDDAPQIAAHIAALPAAERDQVQSLDDITDAHKAELLGSARCLVLPSQHESFGIAILEAWAHATPIVAYDTPVFRSYVRPMETGLLARPEELSHALLRLLQDAELAARIGEQGRRTVLDRFTWAHTAQRYVHAYEAASVATPRR